MSVSLTTPPRQERAAAAIWSRIAAWGRALWATLEKLGRLRATPHIEDLARRWEVTDPELAEQLRRVVRRGWIY